MNRTRHLTSLTALAAAGALLLSACGGAGSGSDEAGGNDYQLAKDGKLIMCSTLPYEPFEFTRDGESVGFDIDLAKKLAERLDLEFELVDTGFEAIESASVLDTQQCDISLAGMTITDDRATKMDFTDPYLLDNLALMVRKDSGVKSIEELKGKEVGVKQATTGETFAQEKGTKTVQFEDNTIMIQAISSGQVNAMVANVSMIYSAVQADDSLELVESYDTDELLGAAVVKGNSALADEFNTMLGEMYEDGSYDDLVDEWFGDVADAARIPEEDRG
ncbi:ABC transporter substrate-binding protein [Brevibacterium otitidis]|uniref:ABC transporter substrate-binding protein n=1 Tax=Brevibacterium otitidis TaxID=53364 RepID=A0ABV5WZF1_9MICO|nr:basic amino acid ABC transporter substrate-binding protein [Brevibacterium otitidis]